MKGNAKKKADSHQKSVHLLKKAILPTFCFAVLSSVAFEDTVHATLTNKNQSNNANQYITKYVNVTGGSLNLRSSVSTTSAILDILTKGTPVTVYSEANGWSKIQVNGKNGYVSSSFLASAKPNVSSGAAGKSSTPSSSPSSATVKKYVNISSGTLNMRNGASLSAAIISNLAKGTLVTVYSEANGWSKIQVNGKNGYVSSSFLTTANPNASSGTAGKSSTSSSSSSAVKKYVKVSSGTLNMRNKDSLSASIIVQLANGTAVTVYSESGGWAYIEAYGKKGYVSSSFLSSSAPASGNSGAKAPQTTTKYVNVSAGSSLNLRAGASSSSAIIKTLARGTKVDVYSEANGWAKVLVNGQTGYVSSSFLSLTNPNSSNTGTSQPAAVTKYVNVSAGTSLDMRTAPSANASIIVKLARGIQVKVDSEANGWSKIEAYGKTGYVNSQFLSLTKPAAGSTSSGTTTTNGQAVPKYVNVIFGTSLNMRSAASTSATVIAKLARGTRVSVLSENNGWSNITVNGQTGYVSSQYLSASQPTSTTSPAPSSGITIVKQYDSYNISLSDMTNIQWAVNPQTDKKYNAYIRADALTLHNATSGTVNGSGWNLRGGAGTDYWTICQVNNQDTLQIYTKVKGADGYDWYQVSYDQTWVNASKEDLAFYLNPNNFLNNTINSLQFLKLSEPANLNASEINSRILSGKGILTGLASSFISAGNKYGVNEIYLISHALLETANGTSQLANGVQINGKTVYNMYGIGAIDASPVNSGAQFAYSAGWFTPEEAIIGGAQFIATGYIDAGQDTLYKMRWNPVASVSNGFATHEYASDIGWAAKQVNQMYNLYSLLDSYNLILSIPQFK